MFDVIVVGSLNFDLAVYSDCFPRPGETIKGTEFVTSFGGKGANQAVACSKLGAKVAMVGKVGNDAYGDQLIENLKSNGVDTEHVTKFDTCSGIAHITVNASTGENAIIIIPGANGVISEINIIEAGNEIKNSKVMLCQLEVSQDVVIAALKIAKNNGLVTVLNPAPAGPLPDEMLKLVDIICPNELELEKICQSRGFDFDRNDLKQIKSASEFLALQGKFDVVVTLGERGAFWVPGLYSGHSQSVYFPAEKVEQVIDTTGAGDSFIGSFGAYLGNDFLMEEAIEKAVKIASISVSRRGAQPSYPSCSELPIDLRLK
mmetsp:Transcript_16890/g.23894  ORF Transcript_16890/g.23894 Transcript_16890/m.23894 type:complete len:317 (+) Transcript_16890:54-1004(+)